MRRKTLFFGRGNAKLSGVIATFSLPAGWVCPGAAQCLSRANRLTGHVKDGPNIRFRCYAASQEALYPSVRQSRWHNYMLLSGLSSADMVALILKSLHKMERIVRFHVSGDFFSQDYFDAWLEVARRRPDTVFYGYTKSLPFWVKRLNQIPPNVKLTASAGGKFDDLIERHGLNRAQVVFSAEEAKSEGLKIDKDDSLCLESKGDFALLLHGTQPVNTVASKAWRKIFKAKHAIKA